MQTKSLRTSAPVATQISTPPLWRLEGTRCVPRQSFARCRPPQGMRHGQPPNRNPSRSCSGEVLGWAALLQIKQQWGVGGLRRARSALQVKSTNLRNGTDSNEFWSQILWIMCCITSLQVWQALSAHQKPESTLRNAHQRNVPNNTRSIDQNFNREAQT